MPKRLGWILTAALVCAAGLASAESDTDSEKARSAGQIMQKRDKACEGLRGQAREDCLGNYVGPEYKSSSRFGRDSIYAGKHNGLFRPKSGGVATRPGRS